MTDTHITRLLVLGSADVERVLDPDRLRDSVAAAMADLSAGRASMPNRIAAEVSQRDGLLAAMPAYLPAVGALTTKLVTLFPRNRDRPTHQAVLVCFDPTTGTPTAVMDATVVTAARTAAASALSTQLLARDNAHVLAILGTGVQARAHAAAVTRVRPFDRVVIAGRDPAAARALAQTLREELGRAIDIVATFADAVALADVVCATTHAAQPVVRWEWVRPGTHITSVGFNTTGSGEIDAETVARSRVFVEFREAALAPPPSGAVELLRAIDAGRIDAGHVRGELGELVSGTVPGRTSPDDVTLYKSVGVAVQDAAAAALVLDLAQGAGIGARVDL
jgi:alanine dehydrogenase